MATSKCRPEIRSWSKSVRGHLHHGLGRAAVHAFAKQLQQVARLGRGVGRGKDSACRVILDGTGEDGLAPAMAQHRLKQKCGGRLAVGSGDTAEFELRFGMSEEICRNGSERTPPVGYFDRSDVWIGGCGGEASGGVSNDGARALRDRLGNVAIAVGGAAAKGDEERAFAHSPRVILDARTPQDLGPARLLRSTSRKTRSSSTFVVAFIVMDKAFSWGCYAWRSEAL